LFYKGATSLLTNKVQEHFKDVQVDVARPNISLTNLRDLPIPSISTDKQTQLANYLSEKLATVEQLKTTLQTQLDSINQLPAALLKQAFSGQL
jgi:restriction endonuclease S subunit